MSTFQYRPRLLFLAIVAFTSGTCQSALADPATVRSSSGGPCDAAIDQFISAPTTENYLAIPHHGDLCWAHPKTKQLQALDALVAGGDKLALELLAPKIRHLDGGELEDALRSVGQYSTHGMTHVIEMRLSGALTASEFHDALTTLPLTLVDDFGAQLAELRARRAAIGKVTDPKAQTLKKAAIVAIDAFISEIEHAQSEMEAQKR